MFTEDDQLTLNPKLELFIYSHSQRWAPRLEGKGLEEQRMVRTKSWRAVGRRRSRRRRRSATRCAARAGALALEAA